MQVPSEISFVGMDPSDAVRRRIEKEISKLGRFHGRITSCHIVVEAPGHHKRKGGLFNVRIFMALPGGGEVKVNRSPKLDHAHEDAYVAIRDAFAAARRQLQDTASVIEGNVKTHVSLPGGRISRLFNDEGYGFIETPEGGEVYFHRNSLVGADFNKLEAGQEVRFSEELGEKGPQASTVHLVGKHHPG